MLHIGQQLRKTRLPEVRQTLTPTFEDSILFPYKRIELCDTLRNPPKFEKYASFGCIISFDSYNVGIRTYKVTWGR